MGQEILDAVKTGPKPLRIQHMLAMSYFNIAVMYRDPKDADRSLEASGKAIEFWTKLVAVAPSVTTYRRTLGWAYFQRAYTLRQVGRTSQSLDAADQAWRVTPR